MGREEQIEEREVLDSIFPDEIADINETTYQISITLDVPGHDDDEEPPSILLTVNYPPDYPTIPPDLSLSHHPTAPRPPHLSLPTDSPSLLDSLSEVITESLGAAMIFTLISTLQESCLSIIAERQNALNAVADAERAKAEEVENAKFHGEAVTRESFLRWREKFREEMEGEADERRRVGDEAKSKKELAREGEGKMSGRELWEKGLVGKVDEEEGEEEVAGGVEGLRVAE